MQDLDQQRDAAGLPHGDAAVLRAGQSQKSPRHLLLISVGEHGEQPEHHLHLQGRPTVSLHKYSVTSLHLRGDYFILHYIYLTAVFTSQIINTKYNLITDDKIKHLHLLMNNNPIILHT